MFHERNYKVSNVLANIKGIVNAELIEGNLFKVVPGSLNLWQISKCDKRKSVVFIVYN